jgi:hypothetical protein
MIFLLVGTAQTWSTHVYTSLRPTGSIFIPMGVVSTLLHLFLSSWRTAGFCQSHTFILIPVDIFSLSSDTVTLLLGAMSSPTADPRGWKWYIGLPLVIYQFMSVTHSPVEQKEHLRPANGAWRWCHWVSRTCTDTHESTKSSRSSDYHMLDQ